MKVIHVIDVLLTKLVDLVLVGLFGVMMGLAVLQVFLRYFFNGSLLWGDTAARSLVIWVGLLGAVLATRQNKHFHIDVLTRFLKPGQKRWLQRCSNLFGAVVCFFLGGAGITMLGIDSGNKTFLDLPVSVVEVIIPAGFYLMMIQFLLRTVTGAVEEDQLSPAERPEAE